jgi:hypothetical protein
MMASRPEQFTIVAGECHICGQRVQLEFPKDLVQQWGPPLALVCGQCRFIADVAASAECERTSN